MRYTNLALPIRAQPFHFGHAIFIKRIAQICDQGVIFLCKDFDKFDNPFPLEVRKKWIEHFLAEEKIDHIVVAERRVETEQTRHEEYSEQFNQEDFHVVTTDENDEMYRSEGFKTLNHHSEPFRQEMWGEEIEPHELHSYGRIIRQRLRDGLSCEGLLFPWVENEAQAIIQELRSPWVRELKFI